MELYSYTLLLLLLITARVSPPPDKVLYYDTINTINTVLGLYVDIRWRLYIYVLIHRSSTRNPHHGIF